MENGYFRPGDPLPKSAKRENAITELLNRVGMTGVAPSKGGSLPAGCVHCAWLMDGEVDYTDYFIPANRPVYIVGSVPDSDIVIVSDILETDTSHSGGIVIETPEDRPYDGIIIESFKAGTIGILRLSGWIEVAIDNPEQFDGFSRYVFVEPYTGTFKWMYCAAAGVIPQQYILESKFLSLQKALVRVESIGRISTKSILVAEHQLFFVDYYRTLNGKTGFRSADRLPTEDTLELLFEQDGSWIGVLEEDQTLHDYNCLKVQRFTGLKANDILLYEQQKSSIEFVGLPNGGVIHAGQDDPNDLITIRIHIHYGIVTNIIKIDGEDNLVNLSTRYSLDGILGREFFDFTLSDFYAKKILFWDWQNGLSFSPSSDTTGCIIGFFDRDSPTGFTYTSGASVLTNS